MSALALLIGLTLAMPAAPRGKGRMQPAKMAARPLPDEGLAAGTVSVLVRQGRSGAEGVAVWLIPADAKGDKAPPLDAALTKGKTNAEGRIFLSGTGHGGRRVVVWVKLGPGYKQSLPFAVPRVGGVRLLFFSGGATMGGSMGSRAPQTGRPNHPPRSGGTAKAPLGPVTADPSDLRLWISFRIMAIEKGKLYLALTYSVVNGGTKTYVDDNHGLLLPMPAGAKGVATPRGSRDATVSKGKIMTLLPVRPGRMGLQIRASCYMPYDQATRPIQLRSHLPLLGYSVSIKKYRQVRVTGDVLSPPQTFSHGDSATPMIVYRSTTRGFPTQTLSFTVGPLPVRSRLGAWLFGLIALLLVGAALGLTLASRRRSKDIVKPRVDPITDELVLIERDRRLGVINDQQAADYARDCLRRAPSSTEEKTP